MAQVFFSMAVALGLSSQNGYAIRARLFIKKKKKKSKNKLQIDVGSFPSRNTHSTHIQSSFFIGPLDASIYFVLMKRSAV